MLLRFETVFRSCDCGLTCGVPDFRDQSARARVVRIDLHGTPSECLCYAVGMSDALPGVAIRQAAKQSSRLAAASLSYTLKAGEGARYAEGGGVLFRG